eukprot:m.10495 g.10495  ORF g.10495 m.10495 type:complete len:749 (-) comp6632_c0_seq2:223-2469(-)
MGVNGLFSLLRPIEEKVHVRQYRGKRVGIDVANWLYKGVYAQALEVFLDSNDADHYVIYCLKRLKLLLSCGIQPYLVFDGDALPMKAGEKDMRDGRKEEVFKETTRLLKEGKEAEAAEYIQKGLDVNFSIRYKMICVCKLLDIRFVVAPYEADAQLAFMLKEGVIDAIISEDSDLIAFGSSDVFFKMDGNGFGLRLQFPRIRELTISDGKKNSFSWKDLTLEQFQSICILSGCDYLPKSSDMHIKGISLKKASKYICLHGSIEKAVQWICTKFNVPEGFLVVFKDALAAFQHQVVFDTKMKVRCPFNSYTIQSSMLAQKVSKVEEEKKERVLEVGGKIHDDVGENVVNLSDSGITGGCDSIDMNTASNCKENPCIQPKQDHSNSSKCTSSKTAIETSQHADIIDDIADNDEVCEGAPKTTTKGNYQIEDIESDVEFDDTFETDHGKGKEQNPCQHSNAMCGDLQDAHAVEKAFGIRHPVSGEVLEEVPLSQFSHHTRHYIQEWRKICDGRKGKLKDSRTNGRQEGQHQSNTLRSYFKKRSQTQGRGSFLSSKPTTVGYEKGNFKMQSIAKTSSYSSKASGNLSHHKSTAISTSTTTTTSSSKSTSGTPRLSFGIDLAMFQGEIQPPYKQKSTSLQRSNANTNNEETKKVTKKVEESDSSFSCDWSLSQEEEKAIIIEESDDDTSADSEDRRCDAVLSREETPRREHKRRSTSPRSSFSSRSTTPHKKPKKKQLSLMDMLGVKRKDHNL